MPQKKSKNLFTRFLDTYRGNFRSAFGDGNTNKGAVRDFKATWRTVNHRSKKYRYSKAKAVGDMVRIRGLNGPEMNFVFCGWPILINTFVAMGVQGAKDKKAKKRGMNNRPRMGAVRNARQYDEETEVRIVAPEITPTGNGGGAAIPPLRSGPYSDRFVAVQLQLIRMGMSRDIATKLADGEFGGQELRDHLTPEELAIFAEYLDRYTSFGD